MTTISFIRTGGTMGQELTATFDLNNMPAQQAERLSNQVHESNFFEIPVVDVVPSEPDEYAYTITVVSGNSIHTIRVTDSIMPKSLRPLIQELTQLAVAT